MLDKLPEPHTPTATPPPIDLKKRIEAKKLDLQTRLDGLKADIGAVATDKRTALTKKLQDLDAAVKAGGDKPDDKATRRINDCLSLS